MATDSFYGEEESVARGWGVGRPSYASGAGPVEMTIESAPPTIENIGIPRGHSGNQR